MPAVPIVGGALALAGGIYAANKASSASKRATDVQREGIDAQLEMYYADVERRKPFYQTGLTALPGLEEMIKSGYDVTKDRGYQVAETSLLKSLNRSLAAKGLQYSSAGVGSTADALTKLQLGYRGQKFNELGAVANLGQQGFAQSPNLTGAYAALGQTYQTDPTASYIMGGVGTGLQAYNNYQLMSRLFPQTPVTPLAGAGTSPGAYSGSSFSSGLPAIQPDSSLLLPLGT